ncbi:heat shock protein 90-5, chloroplastic-like isoform X3 [Macadamia integrifolia]|uniref:heat shock protein 90-5, chloroplastic-like isoform X3 n=1 Tax=Macadamia integrifolia TaxID=60698 RepID=UPI001C4FE7D2|nr:heat shock protein 90-5, chloroplastic-like isoform X3 [Macadamia integrifolia]
MISKNPSPHWGLSSMRDRQKPWPQLRGWQTIPAKLSPSIASDALDKLRFLSVTEPSLLGDAGELEIRIKPDPDNGTITITDTGIGMTKEELVDCLRTIAQSKFLKPFKENKDLGAVNGLIGQFGVGFYSAFLVAEKVVVSTKSPRSDKQYVCEAVADSSSYLIREETNPENLLRRGTQITLLLRPDDDKFELSEPTKIQSLVKNYSHFVSFPIYTWQEKSRTVEVKVQGRGVLFLKVRGGKVVLR